MLNLIKLFWKDFHKAVHEFRQEKCSKYCFICGDNCCNGRLNPSFDNLEPFSHLKKVRYAWERPPESGPFIVDRRFLFFGNYVLVNKCPYLRDGLCALYDDPLRPGECLEYPIYLDVPLGMVFVKPIINVEMSCAIFQYEKNRREISEFAGKLRLEILFHPPCDESS